MTVWQCDLCESSERGRGVVRSKRWPDLCTWCESEMVRTGRKPCRKCGAIKMLEEYPPDKRQADGRRSACRICHQARKRAWQYANREARNARRRARYAANPEPFKAAQRARYAANPEPHRRKMRAYNRAHAATRRAYDQEYRRLHRDIARQQNNVRTHHYRQRRKLRLLRQIRGEQP